jgi:hypothetical protein
MFRRLGILEERVVGNRDMKGREMILVVGARGHVASNWDFTNSQIRKVKGSVEGTRDMRGSDMITAVGSHNDVDR